MFVEHVQGYCRVPLSMEPSGEAIEGDESIGVRLFVVDEDQLHFFCPVDDPDNLDEASIQ
jgi:hypothetical protein